MAERTGYPFREADDHFEAQAAKDAVVMALRSVGDADPERYGVVELDATGRALSLDRSVPPSQ